MADGDKLHGRVVCDTVATSDATVTDLMTYDVPADSTVVLTVSVEAQRYDSGESDEMYSYQCDHIFNKDGSSGAVLRGSATPEEIDPEGTDWEVTVDADGNNARVRVTGTAAEDVRWIGNLTALQIEQEVLGTFSQLSSTFNGTNEYVTMGDVLNYDYDKAQSYSAWIKGTAAAFFLTKGTDTVPAHKGLLLYFNGGGGITCQMNVNQPFLRRQPRPSWMGIGIMLS
ncbi:MAG: hypothetical protein JRD89_19525 [Deltaproteobacteria bacterium]|nr:hypothetical protein [Deltaproteobacteria bacterium]